MWGLKLPTNIQIYVCIRNREVRCVSVCVCLCVRVLMCTARVCVCMCLCVYAYVCMSVCVHARTLVCVNKQRMTVRFNLVWTVFEFWKRPGFQSRWSPKLIFVWRGNKCEKKIDLEDYVTPVSHVWKHASWENQHSKSYLILGPIIGLFYQIISNMEHNWKQAHGAMLILIGHLMLSKWCR